MAKKSDSHEKKSWKFAELRIELNFEKQPSLRTLFELDFDFERISLAITAFTGKKIVPGKTLLFFDEIQWASRGLLALKYFNDDVKGLHVVAAGSMLGLVEHAGDSFPVGKVSYINVFPMSFDEFLIATGNENLYKVLKSLDWQLVNVLSDKLEDILRSYYYVGGMPEAVAKFVSTGDFSKVRRVQRDLIHSYKNDFSRHAPADILPRINLVLDSIPSHLSKENKKFI